MLGYLIIGIMLFVMATVNYTLASLLKIREDQTGLRIIVSLVGSLLCLGFFCVIFQLF